MDKRVVGTLLGIAGMLLWFMPWTEFSMGDMDFYRTGSHIGGIAYILLMSSLAYAVLSWVPQPVPRIIVACPYRFKTDQVYRLNFDQGR